MKGFSDEIKRELGSLALKSPWFNAIYRWMDSGDKQLIADLLEQGNQPPPEALKALAHILMGRPRGVSNRHQPLREKMARTLRRMASIIAKEDIKQELREGKLVKLKGKTVNEMVSERVNQTRSRNDPDDPIATKRSVEEDTKSR